MKVFITLDIMDDIKKHEFEVFGEISVYNCCEDEYIEMDDLDDIIENLCDFINLDENEDIMFVKEYYIDVLPCDVMMILELIPGLKYTHKDDKFQLMRENK